MTKVIAAPQLYLTIPAELRHGIHSALSRPMTSGKWDPVKPLIDVLDAAAMSVSAGDWSQQNLV